MQPAPAPAAPPAPRKTSGLAITAFVLSLLFFLPLLPLIGSILGIVATVRLSSRKHLGGMGLAIAAIPVGVVVVFFLQGMLAAIAIPAFVKYIRKSKAIEATESLDKIRAGLRAYARADHFDQQGNLLPKAVPVGVTDWTPPHACCRWEGRRCVPKAADWQKKPWPQLHFGLSEPHYFQYRYASRDGKRFFVEARADLNCDGTYSSYRLEGEVDASGNVKAVGPIIEREME